jgi:hypothetical protein
MREHRMDKPETERPFTRKEERHLLRLGRKLFMEHHPNPQRIGCPGTQLLRAVAYARSDISRVQQETVIDHLSICSPCYREFYGYLRAIRFRRRIPLFFGVPAIAIVTGVLAYNYLAGPGTTTRPEPRIARQEPTTLLYTRALLDLRGYSPSRSQSPAPTPAQSELALPLGHLALTIVLPLGSDEGDYSIRIGRPGADALLAARGRAEMRDGTTSVQLRFDTSGLTAGKYVLGIRQQPWPWAEYAIELR